MRSSSRAAPTGVSDTSIVPLLMLALRAGFVPAPPGCQQNQTKSPLPCRSAAVHIFTKSTR